MNINTKDTIFIKRFGYGKGLSKGNIGKTSYTYLPEINDKYDTDLPRRISEYFAAQKMNDKEKIGEIVKNSYGDFIAKRVQLILNSPIGFHERLVHFWSNHFAISVDKRIVTMLAGDYELSAIRPNINGNFYDLLLASITHPAMLEYLDQEKSIGPQSPAAGRAAEKGKKIGLNENLAREILELHTLGVNSGYSQKDVTEFAKALTGFSYIKPKKDETDFSNVGEFRFNPAWHQTGVVTFMGREYSQSGYSQPDAILKYIATHPTTAKHIAFKLARHFCADEPPTSLVDRLKSEFIATNGNLNRLYEVLINSPECFDEKYNKFKSPWDWFISSLRAIGVQNLDAKLINRAMKTLGQEILKPEAPKGYDDTQSAWAAPDAIEKRAEIASLMASKFTPPDAPIDIAKTIFGDAISENTLKIVSRAESKQSALALLLISPENMRR
jgi:uncharacterized protein (DUF1800 family)